jgi:hypothetical protein
MIHKLKAFLESLSNLFIEGSEGVFLKQVVVGVEQGQNVSMNPYISHYYLPALINLMIFLVIGPLPTVKLIVIIYEISHLGHQIRKFTVVGAGLLLTAQPFLADFC